MTTWTQWLTTTLSGLATLATFGAGCLTTQGGCVQTAEDLAGFQRTGVDIRHGWFIGTRVTINDKAQATGDLEYDPETGRIIVHFEGNTDPTSIIGAQGERADHLIRLREIESQRVVEQHRIAWAGANQLAQSLTNGLTAAIGLGAPVAEKFLDQAGPLMRSAADALSGLPSEPLAEGGSP